jgi:hypothetical protein
MARQPEFPISSITINKPIQSIRKAWGKIRNP